MGVSLVIIITGAFVIATEAPRSSDEVLQAAGAAGDTSPPPEPSPTPLAATDGATPTPLTTPTPGSEAGEELQTLSLGEGSDIRPTDGAPRGPGTSALSLPWYAALEPVTPTPEPTPTPTATSTPTATPRPTTPPAAVPTATSAPAPTATAVPTATPAPTSTASDDPQPTATPEPTATPQPTATATPSAGGGPTAEQWAALRACESGGNYSINTGNGYYGAYQFSISTWNWVASVHYPSLEGVLPSDAAPGDQDLMAFKLYEIGGWGHWPVCGRHLL